MKLKQRLQRLEGVVAKRPAKEPLPSEAFANACMAVAKLLYVQVGVHPDNARLHPSERDYWNLYLLINNSLWYYRAVKGHEPTTEDWQAMGVPDGEPCVVTALADRETSWWVP